MPTLITRTRFYPQGKWPSTTRRPQCVLPTCAVSAPFHRPGRRGLGPRSGGPWVTMDCRLHTVIPCCSALCTVTRPARSEPTAVPTAYCKRFLLAVPDMNHISSWSTPFVALPLLQESILRHGWWIERRPALIKSVPHRPVGPVTIKGQLSLLETIL